MFETVNSKIANRDKFLEQTRQAREERERSRHLEIAATKIQVN